MNANYAKDDPVSDPKVATHTSDGKKRKVTDNSNRDFQQTILSNRTLLIITITIDPHIGNRVATSGTSLLKIATPQTTEVITDAARSNVQILWTPGHVIRTGRNGTTPGE